MAQSIAACLVYAAKIYIYLLAAEKIEMGGFQEVFH